MGAFERCNKDGIIEKHDALEIFERLAQLYNEVYSEYNELAEGEDKMKYWSITEEIKRESKMEDAANFLAYGDSPEKIAKCTGLPLSKVKKLAAQIEKKKTA